MQNGKLRLELQQRDEEIKRVLGQMADVQQQEQRVRARLVEALKEVRS